MTQATPDLGPTSANGVAPPAKPSLVGMRIDLKPPDFDGDLQARLRLDQNPVWTEGVLRTVLWPLTLVALLTCLVVFLAPWLLVHWREIEGKAQAEAILAKKRAELQAEGEAAEQRLAKLDNRFHLVSLGYREVVKKVTPRMVGVTCLREPGPDNRGQANRTVFDPGMGFAYLQSTTCAGVIVKPGYILTNLHPLSNADRLLVTFPSGEAVFLDLPRHVRKDPLTDLALIHLPDDLPEGLKQEAAQVVKFADVAVGDFVLGLDCPRVGKIAITQGLTAGTDRIVDDRCAETLIQVDGNFANSGGPLFDLQGRFVGFLVETSGSRAVNSPRFALPGDQAKKIVDQLAEHGEVARGWLGLNLAELAHQQAKDLELKQTDGVEIAKVSFRQPADAAGLKRGDVIIRYNHKAIAGANSLQQLRKHILDSQPGTEVAVVVIRDGQPLTLTVQVGKRPADQR